MVWLHEDADERHGKWLCSIPERKWLPSMLLTKDIQFRLHYSPKLLGVRRSCNIGGKLLISEGLRWVWVGRKGCQIDL